LIDQLAALGDSYDQIAGVEARGFILASAIAYATGKGFVPIRKSGKLPAAAFSQSYALEYGEATLQIHQDAITPGQRVLLIDDVLATGGTLIAAAALIEQCGGIVDSAGVILEIEGLGGRENYLARGSESAIHVLL
jgi:adenine phosphoribosyltransferase